MDAKQPAYRVRRLPEPSQIDGTGGKSAWQGVQPLNLNYHMGEEPVHRPRVQARLAWDETALTLIFRVEDRYVRAVAENHQDAVYKDSCVEFFFTPGRNLGHSYFNLEINCGGTMLFWWHPDGGEAIPLSIDDLNRMEVVPSLPRIVDPEISKPTRWTVEIRLPFDLIQRYCPRAEKPRAGDIWRGNFHKCADASSQPHWLTWAPIDHPTPNFHLPEFFGSLVFA